jgi:hypothetical protein
MSEILPCPASSSAPDELTEDTGLASADAYDPLIEVIKKDVDRSLLRENLKLSPAERAQKFLNFSRFAHQLREAGRGARERNPSWGLK